MTVAVLLAATLLAQEAPRDAAKPQDPAVTFPSGGPFGPGTPTVLIGVTKVALAAPGLLDRPYLVDGGWGDFKELYSKVDSSAVRPIYRFKVLIFDDATVLERSPAGVVRQKRTVIDGPDLADLQAGLATFKAMVEGSLGGKVEVKIDVQTEGNPVVVETESGNAGPQNAVRFDLGSDPTTLPNGPFSASFLYGYAFPCFNNDPFETDDRTYRGPFAGVFVVHAGLVGKIETHLAGSTPLSVVPFYRTGDRTAKEAVPAVLYECWKRQLTVKSSGNVEAQTPITLDAPPVPWWGPTIERLALEPSEPSTWTLGKEKGPTWTDSEGQSGVRIELADTLFRDLQTAKAVGWSITPEGTYAKFSGPLPSDLPPVPMVDGARNPPVVPAVLGNFECAQIQDATRGAAYEVKIKGRVCRGSARLLAGDRPPGAGFLNAQIKLSADESIALHVLDDDGVTLATVLLGGDTVGPEELPDRKDIFDAAVPADDQFHAVSIAIGNALGDRKVAEVVLAASQRGGCERSSRGVMTVTVAGLGFADKALDAAKTETQPSVALAAARTGAEPTAEESATLRAALASQDQTERLTALSVLSRVKDVGSVPALAEAARSASVPIAFLASRALAFQGTTDALAELRAIVERAPFDHNQGFAAAQIAPLADPAMVKSLNFLAVQSRLARLESVRALTLVKSPLSGAVLSTMLMTEPDPVVKAEIARRADTDIDLVARRMLFVAVNDPSEVVRASAYARLIDAKDAGIQAEALKGVKDDSPSIRIYLLDIMRQRAKEHYRAALRSAVVDSDPRVRAMALRAFATQPGPVDPDEVRNAFSDPDPIVKKALEELAKAKGFPVPSS